MASTGLYASAIDHAHFLEALLKPGRLLDATSLERLEGRNHNPGFGAGWSYGYQVYGLDYKGVPVFHHYGTSDGFTTGMSWVPKRGFGVVLLTNAGEGAHFANVYAVEDLRWRIIDRFLGLTGAPPDNSTPPATNRLPRRKRWPSAARPGASRTRRARSRARRPHRFDHRLTALFGARPSRAQSQILAPARAESRRNALLQSDRIEISWAYCRQVRV